MISSNTRASRSRFSSPQQTGTNGSTPSARTRSAGPSGNSNGCGGGDAGSDGTGAASTGAERPKTLLQRWLEPPVQMKPSFQDAGLVRHGVVEGMAPLGTMPKAGIFKKAAAPVDATPTTRKIILKRPVSNTTPTPTPAGNTTLDDTEEEEGGVEVGAEDGDDATEGVDEDELGRGERGREEEHEGQDDDSGEEEQIEETPDGEQDGEDDEGEGDDEAEEEQDEEDAGSSVSRQPRLAGGSSRRSLISRDSDQDWAPTKTALPARKSQNQPRRSLPRASVGRSSSLTSQQPAPATPTEAAAATTVTAAANTTTPPPPTAAVAMAMATSATTPTPSKPPAGVASSAAEPRIPDAREAAGHIVKIAVDEALKHFRYPTAWALRTLYDENSDSGEFLTMVREVYSQTATPETIGAFARLVHNKKREGKKDNQARRSFVAPSTTTPQPKQAPYSALVRLEMPKLQLGRTLQTRDRAQPDPAQPQTQPQEKPDQSRDQNDDKAREQDHPDEPARKKRRSGRHAGSSGATNSPSSAKMAAGSRRNDSRAKTESPLKRKTRANSVSSLSSLSSARSMTPPDGIREGDDNDAFDVPPSPRANPPTGAAEGSTNTSTKTHAPAAPRPIAGRRRSSQAKKTRNVSPTSTPPSSTTTTTSANSATAAVTATTTTTAPPPRRRHPHKPQHHQHDQPSQPQQQQQKQSAAAAAAPTAAPTAGTASSASGMPAAVDPPLFPNLSSSAPSTATAAKGKAQARIQEPPPVFPSKVGTLDQNDSRLRLRLNAQKITNGGLDFYPQSFSRDAELSSRARPATAAAAAAAAATPPAAPPPPPPRIEVNGAGLGAPHSNTRSRVSLPASGTGGTGPSTPSLNLRSTRSSRKRQHDETEDNVSPAPLSFAASEANSTAANSRAGTPNLRPAKKTRTGLRVKTSPMKKKAGTSAGIPRASGERNTPVADSSAAKEDGKDGNDDYCSSCSGNGELVCCDGCVRAFHLTCVDPPLREDRMPAEWFCNTCVVNRGLAAQPARRGAFASLVGDLDARNSSAFRLPDVVRDYFDGVRTGVEGEYEEAVAPLKPNTRKKKNEEEQVPDFFRIRDNDGSAILCHACQRATSDNRPIVPCSLCGLWWHTDCLDPPLAYPPVLRTWRCPAHVDDLLEKIPGALGPAHKFRKIRGASALQPSFSRGIINNGYIDVDLDDDSPDQSGWKEASSYGKVYRLSEASVQLDFLERVRSNRRGKPIPPVRAAAPAPSVFHPSSPIGNFSLEEQQAAINLAQLSCQAAPAVGGSFDTLLTEADRNVVSLLSGGMNGHEGRPALDAFDSQSLQAMLSRIQCMSDRIQSILGDRPDAPQDASATANHHNHGPDDAHSSQSTQVERGDVGISASTAAPAAGSDVDADVGKKNLPSPAATEDVTSGAQLEEKPKEVCPATQEPVATLPLLPTESGTTKLEQDEYDNADQPTSDDKTAVEDVVMEDG